MIKELFTDGLLQIAIFLSLLRTDLDSFIGLSYSSNRISPELQETFLGSLSGYTQTDLHSHNLWNAAGVRGVIHPKSIYNSYPESIFRELYSLSQFQRFDGVEHNLNAFLVNGPEPLFPCGQRSNAGTPSPDASNTPTGGNSVPNNNEQEVEGAAGNVEFSPYSENELTKEEMELIEVLWRQDIDLGIGREMFDNSLRLESEKEFFQEPKIHIEEEADEEKEKKPSEEPDYFPMLDLSSNYLIDGETGEIVPQPAVPVQQPEPSEVIDFLDLPDMLLTNSLELPSLDSVPFFENDLPPLEQLDISPGGYQPRGIFEEPQPTLRNRTDDGMPDFNNQLSRQNSLEQRWQDVLGLLDLPEFSADNVSTELNAVISPLPCPSSEAVVQNVLLGNMTFSDQLLLSQDYQRNSLSSFPVFPETDMNVTYQANSGPLMASLDLPSPSIPYTETNASFLNMDVTPSHHLVTPGFSGLNETTNISEFSSTALESLFQNIFDNSTFDDNNTGTGLADSGFSFDQPSGVVSHHFTNADMSSDSAISSQVSPFQWNQNAVEMSDGVDEATGGKDIVSACDVDLDKYEYDPTPSFRSASPYLDTNSSTSSNDTSFQSSKSLTKHVYHNHTYVLQPGQISREEKEEAMRQDKEQKAARSRDEKRAKEMKLPFSLDEIINTPVEDFTQLLSQYSLSEEQQQLIRDIRRRGKNKQAAQNCRKRKLNVIQTLEEEVSDLNSEHSMLLQTRRQLDRETAHVKDKLVRLQTELFRSLRDDSGQPYNPNEYSLQHLPDGNLFLVPKNTTAEKGHTEKPVRKRKPKRKE